MSTRTDLVADADMEGPRLVELCGGTLVLVSKRCPEREGGNEDSALVMPITDERAVLAIADGVGGISGGAMASQAALRSLESHLEPCRQGDQEIRPAILRGIDAANEAVVALGSGAATTLTVAEIYGRTLRTYQVGDSMALVVGQRGKRKLLTTAHSPVGYAVEAGVLDEREAMAHEERHLVSNVVGERKMTVEMSHRIELAQRDTLLVASDGLGDNLHLDEIIAAIRKGELMQAAQTLLTVARARMLAPEAGQPSKPDDLTFVIYRPGRG